MTRSELKEKFRQEVPEATDRVITDAVLNSWCVAGNLEIACKARLIKGNSSFSSVVGQREYSLHDQIANFYDIDDFPGGGVYYDNDPLEMTSISQMNEDRRYWKTEGNGVPNYYWRRNEYLYFDRKPDEVKTIEVDAVLKPEDFNDDNKSPFNELAHLESFHDSILYYLIKRAKAKIGKPNEAKNAEKEYLEYVMWMKNEVNRGIYAEIEFQGEANYAHSGTYTSRKRSR